MYIVVYFNRINQILMEIKLQFRPDAYLQIDLLKLVQLLRPVDSEVEVTVVEKQCRSL